MVLLISGTQWEMLQLISEHSAGIIVLVALFSWDNKKEEEQLAQISRNETLSRLPLRLSTNRVVELVQLRDSVRPVILAGKKETVALAMQKAERFRTELLRRGVLLVPVIWSEGKAAPSEKKRVWCFFQSSCCSSIYWGRFREAGSIYNHTIKIKSRNPFQGRGCITR